MSSRESDRGAVQQMLDILFDISQLLNTQLDRATLAICVSLIENGVNPEALSIIVQYLRREKSLPASTAQAQGQAQAQNDNN